MRKPVWERTLETILLTLKRLLIPALLIWLIGWLWLGGVFAKTAVMAWDGFVDWSASQGLVVEDVIIDGRARTNLSDLKSAVNVAPNDALLSVNVDHIKRNIMDLPWVKSVVVARAYNGVVSIKLVERIPFVMWDRIGRGKVVVDRDGDVIKKIDIDDYDNLLIVRGVDAPINAANLMQMILIEDEVAPHIKGAEWIGDRRWDLITHQNTRIHLPEDDMGFALTRLAQLIIEKDILNQNLLSIDLRGEDRIIIEGVRGQSRQINQMGTGASPITNTI